MQFQIKNKPTEERPRERCLAHGPDSLSLRECLALILGSGPPGIGCLGLASYLMERIGADLNSNESETAFFIGMESSGIGLLQDCKGLGPAARARILAAFELGRRYALFRHRVCRYSSNGQILEKDLPHLALKRISQKQASEPKEWIGFVPIYQAKIVGEFCLVEKGSRTHVNVDPAELFSRILPLRPRGLILIHNHPSGYVKPSQADLDLTDQVDQVAREFGIFLLGHWIVSPCGNHWISPRTSLGTSQIDGVSSREGLNE